MLVGEMSYGSTVLCNRLYILNWPIVATLRCRCAARELLLGIMVVCHPQARGIFELNNKRPLQKLNLIAVVAYNV
jgi:hypothetical protein